MLPGLQDLLLGRTDVEESIINFVHSAAGPGTLLVLLADPEGRRCLAGPGGAITIYIDHRELFGVTPGPRHLTAERWT